MVPAVAVVGLSGSGKTTLVEKLVAELVGRGWRVATLKHDAHRFEMDRPGKDTWRHARAGAAAVAISAPGRFAVLGKADGEVSPEAMVALLEVAVAPQIVIVEGYKGGPFPKVEVRRRGAPGTAGGGLMCAGDPLLLAVATDEPASLPREVAVPAFPLDDPAPLAGFLESRFLGGQTR